MVTALWLVAVLSGPVHGILVNHHSRPSDKTKTVVAVYDHCLLCHFQAEGAVPVLPWSITQWKVPEPQWLVYRITSPTPKTESGIFLRGPPKKFS
ncbi:hypothetical protein EFA69_19850 [Rufibacter immobilis]|uniref:Uncharacterized protein n=1 Tax=Rufibacter immobilis TaxID=1348778 RepID=A0A3M9MS42_9BACT|nr:hypothetical protein EFA69_19850 [Rufibacter immobilis]